MIDVQWIPVNYTEDIMVHECVRKHRCTSSSVTQSRRTVIRTTALRALRGTGVRTPIYKLRIVIKLLLIQKNLKTLNKFLKLT